MKIAILGTGHIGAALGRGWAKAGHEIVFGTRAIYSEKIQELATECGAQVASLQEAVDSAEIITLAIPWSKTLDLLSTLGGFSNKIVIDATNPIAPGFQLDDRLTTSAAEEIAARMPSAHVVKAFNATGAENVNNPHYDGQSSTVFICGDTAVAKATVTQLAVTLGFDVADVGDLKCARFLEPLGLTWMHLAILQGNGRDIAFKLMRR